MDELDWTAMERAATSHPSAPARPGLVPLWFSMKGRIPRSTYWLKFALPIFVIQMAGNLIDAMAGTLSPQGFGPMSLVTWVLVLYPCLVGAVKRLHDLGHPGWYLGVLYGGLFGSGLALALAVPALGGKALLLLLPAVALLIASIWFSIKMAFVRGTFGPNAYGPDPLQWGPAYTG